MKIKNSYLILFAVATFFFICSYILANYSVKTIDSITNRAIDEVNNRSLLSKSAFLEVDTAKPENQTQLAVNYFKEFQLGLYVWNNDSLIFWNNSELPITLEPGIFNEDAGVIKNEQAYFLYFKEIKNNKTYISCSRLKPRYLLENNYLKNDFAEWTKIPPGLTLDLSQNPTNPVSYGQKTLFGMKANESQFYDQAMVNLATNFYLFAYAGIFLLVLLFAERNGNPARVVLLVVLIACIRVIFLAIKFPEFIYHSSLYDLKLFGNAHSFFNAYLGDILLNALSILALTFLGRIWMNKKAIKNTFTQLSIAAFLVSLNLIQFNFITESLVTNSTLNFDFLNVFNLQFPAFIALGAIGLYFIAFFIAVGNSVTLFEGFKKQKFFKFLLFYLILTCVLRLLNFFETTSQIFWPVVYAAFIYILSVYGKIKSVFLYASQLVLMSFITSYYLNEHISKNQSQDLEILSLKLSEKQDAILENEFENLPEKIKNDSNLSNLIDFLNAVPGAANEINILLKQKYFSGYFDRFNVEFSLFDKMCHPLLQVKSPLMTNQGYFEDQIQNYSIPTTVNGLYYVYNNKMNSRYIGQIELKDKTLFVWMEPKQFEDYGSFPDLLLDQSQQKPEKLKAFSHAVYRMQLLTNRYGDFHYPLFLQDSLVLESSNVNYLHRYYRPDENTVVIISERQKNWNYFFTFNSYLLIYYSFLAYLTYVFYSLLFTNRFYHPTLTRRIQSIIIALLFLAMLAVGVTSGTLVSRQFSSDNKKQLDEKTQIIISELNSQFESDRLFDDLQIEAVNLKLKEYARLFNTPISLFQANGKLFNTSENKFYELGLAAPLMNPGVLYNLRHNFSSSESVMEQAGNLQYISHYAPLFDTDKKLVGYLNLPYFAKQSDLANELSGIISALINVYVILFVISILAGLILSGLITQPLRFIKQQLSSISLGKQNEKIVWYGDDEVGRLVFEYNQMLVKLEKSAELLAQSEREIAWREMAKQVAHEIKNPLTPMKLNLQYLQHLIKQNAPDFKEKFEKASVGIIEQIDSLASIATAFSNFAQLPGTQLKTINLVEIINASLLLFTSEKHMKIINTISQHEIWVKGDRDQCLRVFNNIFKNATQAMESVQEPCIEISVTYDAGFVIVSIHDNGCGIDEDLQSKIFTPNFTTKSSGSGLGLAMVKSSMLGFKGDVWFESKPKHGSTFFLKFSVSEP